MFNPGSKIYHLHIPKSGGSSIYYTLKKYYKFKDNVINGNWVNENQERIRFWNFEKQEQLEIFDDVDIIFNENELGDYFYPENVLYFAVLRNPIDIIISMLQNFYVHKENKRHLKKIEYKREFDNFLEKELKKEHYKNYMLKFFYKFSERDSNILLQVALERVKKINIIKFSNIEKDFNILFHEKFNKNIKLDHIHKRYGEPIVFKDLNVKNQQKLQEILKEDIIFFNYCDKNY